MTAMQRRGRPIKKVAKGERTQLGVMVSGKIKALLLKQMKESGRTISGEACHMIEKAFLYDDWLALQKRIERRRKQTGAKAADPY